MDFTPKKSVFANEIIAQYAEVGFTDVASKPMESFRLSNGNLDTLYTLDVNSVTLLSFLDKILSSYSLCLIGTSQTFPNRDSFSRKRPGSFFNQITQTNEFLSKLSSSACHIPTKALPTADALHFSYCPLLLDYFSDIYNHFLLAKWYLAPLHIKPKFFIYSILVFRVFVIRWFLIILILLYGLSLSLLSIEVNTLGFFTCLTSCVYLFVLFLLPSNIFYLYYSIIVLYPDPYLIALFRVLFLPRLILLTLHNLSVSHVSHHLHFS